MSSPKHDVRDLAARFARKARSDEIALEQLAEDPDVPDDLIGFHAQHMLRLYELLAGLRTDDSAWRRTGTDGV